MKNYDIKNATSDLSLKQKIVVSKKRLAFLVSNMFSRISKGYNAKIQELKTSFENVHQEAETEKKEIVKVKLDNIEEKVETKEEAIIQVKQSNELSNNEKNYIVKAYEDDIESLREKQVRVSAAPRRLLISKIFLQKLVANRKNKIVQKRINKKIEEKLSNVPDVEEKMPINSVEDAMRAYIEYNNERIELDERIKKIQQKIRDLVSNYGLTKDMFEEITEKTK